MVAPVPPKVEKKAAPPPAPAAPPVIVQEMQKTMDKMGEHIKSLELEKQKTAADHAAKSSLVDE